MAAPEGGADAKEDAEASAFDELPFWAAPFGLRLLERVRLLSGSTVLDVGFGTGFPLLELAMRLGPSSAVHGLDPWAAGHRRTAFKRQALGLANVTLHVGIAEAMPFGDQTFDLVVSNNGYNNVQDRDRAFRETARVCRDSAQLVFTMNLDESFHELHDALREVLLAHGLVASTTALSAFIAERRPPLEQVLRSLSAAGFSVDEVTHDASAYRLADSAALRGHAFFRRFQLPHLEEVVPEDRRAVVFDTLYRKMDEVARAAGELRLSVPFVTVTARRVARRA